LYQLARFWYVTFRVTSKTCSNDAIISIRWHLRRIVNM
jgi:hypothetical protein